MTIAAGKYTARAVGETVLGKSKKQETPFIEFYFEVKGGEANGERVRWTSYFSEKTSERTIDSLRLCGWDGDDLSVFSDGQLHGLDKKEVSIVVEIEKYKNEKGEDRESAKVAWVNRIGFLNVDQRMNDDAASAFAAKMNDLVALSKHRKPQVVSDTGGAKDDIPF